MSCFFCLALCVSNFVHVAVCNKNFFFFFWWGGGEEFVCFLATLHSLQIFPYQGLNPGPGIESSPEHWITQQVPEGCFFIAGEYPIVWLCPNLFIHSTINRHLRCFQFRLIWKKSHEHSYTRLLEDTCSHVFWRIRAVVSVGYLPRSVTAKL